MITRILSVFWILLAVSGALAQSTDSSDAVTRDEFSETQTELQGIQETVSLLVSTVDALKLLKFSGYIQAQYQVADAAGIVSTAGGDFRGDVQSRFGVRRGRLKATYTADFSTYVLQIDVTQAGVAIKDAYINIVDPWVETYNLRAGVMDRPFGFEVMYSSSLREMPERARIVTTLFPGERDIGAKIEIAAPDGMLSNFNLQGGIYNGVLNTATENDRNKDFIGRFGYSAAAPEAGVAIDAGASLYSGKVTNTSKYVYSIDPSSNPKSYMVDSAASNVLGSHSRIYYGGDLQFYYDLPVVGGFTLRGEYITGEQPGTSTRNTFYNPYRVTGEIETVTPLYKRNFSGFYIAYVQNLGSLIQLMARYDEIDPNTDVEGSDIGVPGSNLTVADIGFRTLGVGGIFHFNSYVKFVLYYDIVENETVASTATGSLADFKQDVKDNVFTIRTQFKF